jgi:predicted Zn-dependent protease
MISFNESDFHWHFAYQIKNVEKILMEQNDIYWNLQNFIFWKNKIDYNRIIVSTKNNLIIVTSSVKQHGTQMYNALVGCG